MQPLTEQIDAIQTLLTGVDPGDLSALADVHSRFEALVALAGTTPGMEPSAVGNLSARGEDARRKLEQLILNEASDAASHLNSIREHLQEITGLLGGAGARTNAPVPTDHFEAARQEVAKTPVVAVSTHSSFPEAAHLVSEEDLPLISEFIAEATSHLETAEQEILRLEEDPGNLEAIGSLFRAFHTIKGVAGFLNLNQIQSLAHAAENLLDLGRDGKVRVTGAASELVLQSADVMKRLVARLDEAARSNTPMQPLAGVKELAAQLNNLADRVTNGTYVESASTAPNAVGAEPATAGESAESSKSTVTGDASVKVATNRLDNLINMVGELVIANSMVSQDVSGLVNSNQRLGQHVSHLGKIVRDLQDLSMSLRMVPVNSVFRKMTRLVRDVARKAGKEVELVITGADTELDRNVVEALGDPLVHMVRNSVDHGIEPPDQRGALGKPRQGRIDLRAYHKGGNINIDIIDDGRGLDRDKILAKAIKNGLVAPDATPSDQEIYRMVFAAGLSTAEKVTDISGRGVGMDVVKKNIDALRGRVDITTEKGRGSTFTIRLPLTLAVIDGLVVKVGDNKYIVPITSIEQSIRPTKETLSTVQGRGELINVRGALLPLVRLHRLFNVEPRTENPTDALVVIVHDNDRRVCLFVDDLLGQEQVVIKSLGTDVGRVQGISGCAVLGDGNVSLILDVPGIVDLAKE